LWSVREDVSKDPKAALAKIAKMGYKNVEGFGYSNGKFWLDGRRIFKNHE
jgi:sugar phosphate isomerase/epimerase